MSDRTTTPHEVQLSQLIAMEDPQAVMAEVEHLVTLMHPAFDFAFLRRLFTDVTRLFAGEYPGYRACNTTYHNLQHTTDATMAMARLLHGAACTGALFNPREIEIGLAATLLHDVGYIQQEDDDGTGAKYTQTHIERSADFLETYFRAAGLPDDDIRDGRDMLACTGLTVRIADIRFRSFEVRTLGMMLGTADLIGQMADRAYLEKLAFLYREFKEGNVPGFEEEIDLYVNTLSFYEITKRRFATELGGVNRFMRPHFRARWGIDRDLYEEAVERQMVYLREIIEHYRPTYREHLRRWKQIGRPDEHE